jgi:signal transduction histidine kinase
LYTNNIITDQNFGDIVMSQIERKVLFSTLIILLLLSVTFVSCKKDSDTTEPSQVRQDDVLSWNKKIAAAVVHTNARVIANGLKSIPDEQQRIAFIRSAVDSAYFYDDKSGYFYVYDYNCVNIAHATQKDLQGQNLYNHVDTHGNYVIRELAAAAKNGGGFVEFYWIKPGTTGEKQKLGYVEPIPGSSYFIGTGVYLE